MITLIVAVSENHGIGNDGKIPWNIPEDMKYFRKKTTGKSIIMGRNTFESIGHPLPKRQNIIITSRSGIPGCFCVTSLHKAIEIASKEIMIIGGQQIYDAAMYARVVDRVLLTRVKGYFEADKRFVHNALYNEDTWEKIWEEPHDAFTFIEYRKVN